MDSRLWTRLLTTCVAIQTVCGEITQWTNPEIDGAQGSGYLYPYILENRYGVTGVVVRAESGFINYYIIYQKVKDLFAVNETTGLITVAEGITDLDPDSGPDRYELVIWAKGDDFSEGTATATVFITDLNDNAPFFDETLYEAKVRPGAGEGTVVTTVTATDIDMTSPNNHTEYSITGGDSNRTFTIDTATGTISVRRGKTVELTPGPSVNLTVSAIDHGIPPLTGNTIVMVVISRANRADIVYITVILPMLYSAI